MEPSKQESVSRQSSILKPTKPRQPLQCVVANPSSADSSPTLKIKRRVSFAKNKQIKEFCNEADQGTVWDDTYEERDSSGTKSNSTGGTDLPLTITIPCHEKENFPVQLFLQTDEIECKEVSVEVPIEEGDNLSQCDMEMDNTLENPQVQNKNVEGTNTTIYCDDGMDMTSYIPSRIIACNKQNTNFLEDKVPIDITENLPLISHKNSVQQNNAGNSTDLTVAISQLLGAGRANKQTSDQIKLPNTSYNPEICENRMNNSTTVPMEFTSILPSSTWIRPNSLCHSDKRTENFDNQTMEFTVGVSHTNTYENQNKDTIDNMTGKTKIFADKSMELTESIPVNIEILKTGAIYENLVTKSNEKTQMYPSELEITKNTFVEQPLNYREKSLNNAMQNKTEAFTNKSIERTDKIPILIDKCKEISSDLSKDKTEIFNNRPVEMTEAIPDFIENREKIRKEFSYESETDKTEIFNNISVEMTEAIPVFIENRENMQRKSLHVPQTDKTEIFNDRSVEMTEAIPVFIENRENMQRKSLHVPQTDKTEIFNDRSVEMTEAIPVFIENRENLQRKSLQVPDTDKTKIFDNMAIETTEVIPSYNKDCRKVQGNSLYIPETDKTKIFDNMSIETTGAIPVYHENYEKMQRKSVGIPETDKTKIFDNIAIETTEVIPSYNKDCRKVQGNSLYIPETDKTKIFDNMSIETTGAIPVYHENYEKMQRKSVGIPETDKTKIFDNMAIETTGAIPVNHEKIQRKSLCIPEIDKTKIFNNRTIETTEAIPIYIENREEIKNRIPVDFEQNKTEIFTNKLVEVTEAIPGYIENCKEAQKNPILTQVFDKTNIFNKSIETTEAVQPYIENFEQVQRKSLYKKPVDETKIFSNKSMDITEAISALSKNNEDKQEKTKNFQDTSMEITNVVSNKIESKTNTKYISSAVMQENTNILFDKSMELTEAVPVSNRINNQVSPITDQMLNKSMELTNTIPAYYKFHHSTREIGKVSHELVHNRTDVFDNNLMEMTEAISASNKNNQFLFNEPQKKEKTRLLHETAMEMTEAVPVRSIYQCNPKIISTEEVMDKVKVFSDTSMEMTVPNVSNLSKKIDHSNNQSILSNRPEVIPNSMNVSQTYNTFNRNETFHRITSDELNTLCASMNLPIQKYDNESATAQNSSIPMCNNVSALRESLRNGTLFQQQSSIHPTNSSIIHTPAKALENFQNKNNSEMFCDMDVEEQIRREAIKDIPEIMDTSALDGSFVNKFPIENFDTTKTNLLSKSITAPIAMETDKTAEISMKTIQHQQQFYKSNHVFHENLPNVNINFGSQSEIVNYNSNSMLTSTRTPDNAMLVDDINKTHSIMDVSKIPANSSNKILEMHKSIKVFDQNTKNTFIVKESLVKTDDHKIQAHCKYMVNEKPGKVDIYHDISMEVSAPSTSGNSSSTLSGKRKSDEMYDNVVKKNPANATKVCKYSGKDKSIVALTENNQNENSLTRLPSDNTELLIATMGFKTELAHPLIINDKTMIKISQKPLANKTYVISANSSIGSPIESNKTYTIDSNSKNQIEANKPNKQVQINENQEQNVGKHVLQSLSMPKNSDNSIEAQCSEDKIQNKENLSQNIELHLFKSQATSANLENHTEVINDQLGNKLQNAEIPIIESPVIRVNFENQIEAKCSNNSQTENTENQMQNVGIPIVKSPGKPANLPVENEEEESDKENQEPSVKINLYAEKYSALEEIQPPSFLESDSMHDDFTDIVALPDDDQSNSPLEDLYRENPYEPVYEAEIDERIGNEEIVEQFPIKELNVLPTCNSNSIGEKTKGKNNKKLSEEEGNVEEIHESIINETIGTVEEPMSPFLLLTENIKAFEKRDDCIWSIRIVDQKLIAVDFIAKSLVIVIRLNELEEACLKDIEKIEVISRLRGDSKNTLLRIVHNLLIAKLIPNEMLEKYKMYEDILPLLEFVSKEVIFAMNFMFDLQKLTALNLFNVNEKRIQFMVASKKSNIIVKISLILKMFHEICPDDIDVICILGEIRKSDIKQLIVNIKRDYKFLSRYIKDVKDYITLMEESSSFHKY